MTVLAATIRTVAFAPFGRVSAFARSAITSTGLGTITMTTTTMLTRAGMD